MVIHRRMVVALVVFAVASSAFLLFETSNASAGTFLKGTSCALGGGGGRPNSCRMYFSVPAGTQYNCYSRFSASAGAPLHQTFIVAWNGSTYSNYGAQTTAPHAYTNNGPICMNVGNQFVEGYHLSGGATNYSLQLYSGFR